MIFFSDTSSQTLFAQSDRTSTRQRDRVSTKLQGFQALPKGWHYGHGRGPDHWIVGIASWLHREATFLGFTNMDAFPGVDGEIMLTIYAPGNHYAELTVEADGTVSLVHEANREEKLSVERQNVVDVRQHLRKIASSIWSTSDSSISVITTPRGVSSKVLPSKIPQPTGHFRLFKESASTKMVDPFVIMQDSFIQVLPPTLQSTGNLTMHFSRLEPA